MRKQGIVIVLEDACIANVKRDSRTDILHQCLLVLLDSGLNLNGMLKVLIRTQQNELIDVSPYLKVPRTAGQFECLLEALVEKRKVKSRESDAVLMEIIKNDLTCRLPPGHCRIGLSSGGRRVDFPEYIKNLNVTSASESVGYAVVFHVGVTSNTSPLGTVEDVSECISISDHRLTAAHVCARLCSEFERCCSI